MNTYCETCNDSFAYYAVGMENGKVVPVETYLCEECLEALLRSEEADLIHYIEEGDWQPEYA